MTPQEQKFWDRFRSAMDIETAEPADIFRFGDSAAMSNELLDLVLSGRKRATCALARWYGPGLAPLPVAGALCVILDGDDQPRCVIRTASVELRPVRAVEADFARDEGEGDLSLEWWRAAHLEFWQREANREGFTFSEDLDALLHRFVLVWSE
ncbi:ASCH domain-containing protein [uncultured Maricaulis sp.]|uniref:ASCH domain-containing protein n=1 Tax=uncultured Maricaulis sp. TaxID=174710 RepID=UPI0030DB4C4D|tara:strand:+ start:58437 stop:58895 length:459 start_codon:yes stop_codon:yes gene_type:complete